MTLAAQRLELGAERVDDVLAPAGDDGPALRVGDHREPQRERSGERRGERAHRVRRRTGHHRPCLFGRGTAGRSRRREAARSRPNRASASGWRRHRAASERARWRGSGRRRARVARTGAGNGSRRSRASTAVSSTDEPRTAAARPPSSGWANATSGMHSRTWRASRSMSRKNGDAMRSGWTAEHTSWWNPGSVSSSVRHPPPGTLGALSKTSTERPAGDVTAAEAVRARTDDDHVGVRHRRSSQAAIRRSRAPE